MIVTLTFLGLISAVGASLTRRDPIARSLGLVVVAGILPMTRLPLGGLHVLARCAALGLLAVIATLSLVEPGGTHGRARVGEVRFRYHPLSALPYLGLIGLASVAWSINPTVSIIQGAYAVVGLLVLSALGRGRWVDAERCGRDVLALLFPIAAVLGWGLVADLVGASYLWSGGRRSGLFANPNPVGHLATISICLTWFSWRRRLLPRWLCGVLGGIGMAAIVLTQSRAAFIGLFVAALVMVLGSRERASLGLGLLAVALSAGALSIVVMLDEVPALGGVAARFDNSEGTAAVASRSALRDAAIRTWQDRPITGLGFGSTATAMTEIDRLDSARRGSLAVHNGYVQLLLELGLFGAVPTLTMLGHLLIGAHRRLAGTAGAAIHAAAAAIAAISLVESTLFSPLGITSFILWALAVMAWAMPAETASGRTDPADASTATSRDRTPGPVRAPRLIGRTSAIV